MRALSLTQPWSQLVATGAKSLETRCWPRGYRGPLAIHASKRFPRDAVELCFEQPFARALRAAGIRKPAELPRGAIVAVVDLVDVRRISTRFRHRAWLEELPRDVREPELSFGDVTPGRYGWRLANVRLLPRPVVCRGSLGLWRPLPGALEQIADQLRALGSSSG